jgi:predicted alpha/beta superfamily hydrolase
MIIPVLLGLLLANSSDAQITDSSKMASAEIKSFHSKILGENRTIHIQTPSKMRSTDQYPVIYLLDGESFISMAGGQVQYLSESYKIIPSMIVVGIKSTDRFKDLTPTHSLLSPDGKRDSSANSPFKKSGGGDKFLQFLKEELFPYIEANYPTAPYRILYGHSLGGLMAVHALLNHTDLFNAYIAISPSFQWDERATLKIAANKLNSKNAMNKILFFSDANEGASFHANQLSFDSILNHKKIPGLKFKYTHYAEETHISEPVKAFYDGIRLIYPDWHLPYNTSAFRKIMTSAMIIKHYEKLSSAYKYNVLPPQDEINAISRFLANDPARIKDAMELLQMNAHNYPKSAAIYEIMGDTYIKAGDKKNARLSYERSLTLDPGNDLLKKKLEKIPD